MRHRGSSVWAKRGHALGVAARLRSTPKVHGHRAAGADLIAEALASRTRESRRGIAGWANHVMRRGPRPDEPGAVGSVAIARALVSRGATERRAAYRIASRIADSGHVVGAANVGNALVAMAYSTTSAGQRADVMRRADRLLASGLHHGQPGARGAAAIARARASRGTQRPLSFKIAARIVEDGPVAGVDNVGNALVAMALSAGSQAERSRTQRHIEHVLVRPQVYRGAAVGAAHIAAAVLAGRNNRPGALMVAGAAEAMLDRTSIHTSLGSANAAIAIVIATE